MHRIEEENKKQRSKLVDEVRRKKEEVRQKEKRQEKEKEKQMSEGEKELWESGDWRDHVKDLNASFSKVILSMYSCSLGKKYIFYVVPHDTRILTLTFPATSNMQGEEEERERRGFYCGQLVQKYTSKRRNKHFTI